jgi:hypothetical protein
VDFNQRVFVAVFPLSGVFGSDGGTRYESKTVIKVFKNNEPVIVGV